MSSGLARLAMTASSKPEPAPSVPTPNGAKRSETNVTEPIQPTRLPRPDWFDKDPSEWPSAAREFYRLCLAVHTHLQLKRSQEQQQQAAQDAC